jgi:spermidine synthase
MNIFKKAKILYQKQSMFNDIAVIRRGNTITLWSGDNKQTEIEVGKGTPFRTSLEYSQGCFLALSFHPDPVSILVLGLGGGAIPTLLQTFLESSIIHVVELDPEMGTIAQRFFHFTPSERLQLFISDAFNFVKASAGRYDLVLIDAYIENRLAKNIRTTAFMTECARIINPGGILVANLMTGDKALYNRMIKILGQLFEDLWLLPMSISTNTLAFASTRKISTAILRQQTERLPKQISFDFKLPSLINRLEHAAHP